MVCMKLNITTPLLCLIILLSIIVFVPIPTSAHPLTLGDNKTLAERRYCSDQLTEAILLACGGRVNSFAKKYPHSHGNGNTQALKRLVPDNLATGTFYSPLRDGAVHECCIRPCGYGELRQYCEPDQ